MCPNIRAQHKFLQRKPNDGECVETKSPDKNME